MSSTGSGEVAGAQTVTRALLVLGLLRQSSGELGVTEIARELGLNVTTAHRLLRALVAGGYVAQNTDTERYGLGRESFLLGLAAERTLGFAAVTPLLERLCERTGESANLVVRDGGQGLVVLRVDSPQPLRFSQPAGTRIPLHCTSSGKVLLAFADDPGALLECLGDLPRLTDHTVTSRGALLKELHQIQERGYALNEGERHPGVSGAAAPVSGGARHVVAALAVQGPQVRMPHDRLAELGELVRQVAAEVAALLPSGYRI